MHAPPDAAAASSNVQYDTAAWSLLCVGNGLVPTLRMRAPCAARIAAHATRTFVDAVRVFGALTHCEEDGLDALVQYGWQCDTIMHAVINTTALLCEDRAGCLPWLSLANEQHDGMLQVGPVRALAPCPSFDMTTRTWHALPVPCWLLVHNTADNTRSILELDACTGHIAAQYSVRTGKQKPARLSWAHHFIIQPAAKEPLAIVADVQRADAVPNARVLLIERGHQVSKCALQGPPSSAILSSDMVTFSNQNALWCSLPSLN